LLMSFVAGARCGAPLLLLESMVTVRGLAESRHPFLLVIFPMLQR